MRQFNSQQRNFLITVETLRSSLCPVMFPTPVMADSESSARGLMKLVCSVKRNWSAFAEQFHTVTFSLSSEKSCAASTKALLQLLGNSCATFTCESCASFTRLHVLLSSVQHHLAGWLAPASRVWILESCGRERNLEEDWERRLLVHRSPGYGLEVGFLCSYSSYKLIL